MRIYFAFILKGEKTETAKRQMLWTGVEVEIYNGKQKNKNYKENNVTNNKL